MQCPFCRHKRDRVIDSRTSGEGTTIRRRRLCTSCKRRFTTYERVEEVTLMVVKKDNRREPYDRAKIVAGLKKACEKRPVSMETIDRVADRIETEVMERGEREVPSALIGQAIMRELHELDQVAYVRFASVYREFKDINEFLHELQDLMKRHQNETIEPSAPRSPERKGGSGS